MYSLKISKSVEICYLFNLVVIEIKFTQRRAVFKILNDTDQILAKTQCLNNKCIVGFKQCKIRTGGIHML